MASIIEEFFKDLKESVALRQGAKAKLCISNILGFFKEELTGPEIDMTLSVILHKNDGIIPFIRAHLGDAYLQDSIKLSLEVLLLVIEEFPARIQNHADDISKICLLCLYANKLAKEKALALQILLTMVDSSLSSMINTKDLVTKLMHQLEYGKLSSMVYEQLFPLLGLLARDYPLEMRDHVARVQVLLHSTFETQTQNLVTMKLRIIHGVILGFDYLYSTFAPDPEVDKEACLKLYKILRTMSYPGDIKFRQSFRGALKLFASHGHLVSEHLYNEYKWWHNTFLEWFKLSWEDIKVAIPAIEVFHEEIAKTLLIKQDPHILHFFIAYFKTQMQSTTTKPHELRIIIRGFGTFSACCSLLMSEEDINPMYNLVVQRTEQLYLSETKYTSYENLPEYVHSLSVIVSHMPMVNNIHMKALQNLIVILLREFYQLSESQHVVCLKNLVNTFMNLTKLEGCFYEEILEVTIYQGVIWSCSHALAVDIIDDNENFLKKVVNYKTFLPLWKGLLMQKTNNKGELSMRIFDNLMKAFVNLINKLDLSTKRKTMKNNHEEEVPLCDLKSGLEPNTPKDFHIFINLVDLYKDLIVVNYEWFKKWIPVYLKEVVSCSYKFPIVSGFYKLFSYGLQICDNFDYFEHYESAGEEVVSCFMLVRSFLQDCILYIQRYTSDLQVSCLQVLLATPVIFIPELLNDATVALQVIFKIGHSYLPLANMGLSTLERWTDNLSKEHNELLLHDVLPSLDSYLQCRRLLGDPDVKLQIGFDSKHQKKAKKQIIEGTQSELAVLQRRIIAFLGKLDSTTCLTLISQNNQELHDHLVPWDLNQHLKFRLPCPDIKPIIFLDKLLPRVAHLVLESSDRQTRVAACELLHSTVLFLLGTGVQVDTSRLRRLYEHLFPCLLQLACDTDSVVVQLFDPLMIQIIHWLSSQWRIKSPETALLIDNLMDGISHQTASSIRDVSAKYLQEFVRWSLRQNDRDESATSSVNLKAIVRKICDYSLNPSAHKQFGAALAFNNLYTILRESEKVVDEFWLELCCCFIQSLMLNETDTNSIQQITEALNHVMRVFEQKSELFNKETPHRRVPALLRGAQLKDIAFWLFKQCGIIQIHCRLKCMEMFLSLSALVDECTSALIFVHKVQQEYSYDIFIKIAENCENENGINAKPTLDHLTGSEFSTKRIFDWMRYLLTSLDFYVWIFKERFCSPSIILDGSRNSKILIALEFFIDNLVMAKLNDIPGLLEVTHNNILHKEQDEYTKLKYTILRRMYSFICEIVLYPDLGNINFELISPLWNNRLWDIIIVCLCRPQTIGFEVHNKNIGTELPNIIVKLLATLKNNLQEPSWLQFETRMTDYLDTSIDDFFHNMVIDFKPGSISRENKNYLIGLSTLHKNGLIRHLKNVNLIANAQTIHDIFNGLIEVRSDNKYSVILESNVVKYYDILLSVIFQHFDCKILLVNLVLNETIVKGPITDSQFTHGQHFFVTFDNSILQYMLQWPEEILIHMIRNLPSSTPLKKRIIVNVITRMFLYIHKNNKFDNLLIQNITFVILNNWSEISQSVDNLDALDIIMQLVMIFKEPLSSIKLEAVGFSEWCFKLLNDEQITLDLKVKVLKILPFITGPQDVENVDLTNALKKVQTLHFPLESTEYTEGSMERSTYVAAFTALLHSLYMTASPVVLERVIAIIAGDTNHICEDNIHKFLSETMKNCPQINQLQLLQVSYNQIKMKDFSPFIRISILKRVLTTMLKSADMQTVEQFYVKFMKEDFLTLVDSPYTSATRKWEFQQVLVDRICALHLIMILVFISEPSSLSSASNPIVRAFPEFKENSPKEMLAMLSRKAFKSRTFINHKEDDNETTDIFRQYQCAAYKTLCAIICNTRIELKFYTGLLFRENIAKREIIWKNLIDCKKSYEFPQDFDDFPKTRKHLLAIRKAARMSSDLPAPDYLSSQSLFSSSLSQDITAFDLTHAMVRKQEKERAAEDVIASEIYLTEDSLNEHECMDIICGVIGHMIQNNICPHPLNVAEESQQTTTSQMGSTPLEMPLWMEAIQQTLSDSDTPVNVKLFLVRVIDNCQAVFKPYAHHMLTPILEVITDGCAGTTVNSFIADTVALLLSWHDVAIPSSTSMQRNLASQFLHFLMKNAYNEKRQFYKLNLDLIKNVVEIWKPCLELPLQFLYNEIRNPVKNGKACPLGLELAAIVLANGFLPWSDNIKEDYFKGLIMNFDAKERAIYQPCSEVIGMALKLNEEEELKAFESLLFDSCIKRLEYLKKSQADVFLTCLYGIFKHYPKIADKYLVYVIYHTTHAVDVQKEICLQIILSRFETLGEQLYLEILTLDFELLLKDKQVCVLVLHIINKLLPFKKNDVDRIKYFLRQVKNFVKSAEPLCRNVVYDIAIWCYNMYSDNNEGEWKEVVKEAQNLLLVGLLDSDERMKIHVQKFWQIKNHLPNSLHEVFLFLMERLYDESLEDCYLEYGILILLQTALTSPDAGRKIFEHPLSECKFNSYRVRDSWRFQHASIAPLFAETFVAHSPTGDISDKPSELYIGSQTAYGSHRFSTQRRPLLQATPQMHQLQFEPTIAQDSTMQPDLETFIIPTMHYLMFDSNQVESRTYVSASGQKKHQEHPGQNTFHHLRRRLLKDKDKMSRVYASKAIAKNQQRKRIMAVKPKMKASQITMYRQYRIGDFPDIEISNSEIILPLQELAKRDSTIARAVFFSIYIGIVSELNPELQTEFIKRSNLSIELIFKNSQLCNTSVMSTMFEMALEYSKNVNVEPDVICLVSHTSQLLPLGALLLESKLTSNFDDDHCSSKRVTNVISPEHYHWLKLAEIYQSMSEYDTTQGIFLKALDCDFDFHKGLELEYSGDYYQAMKCYEKALSSSSARNAVEEQFYKESYFKSFVNLGLWDDLNEGIKQQIDSTDDFWNITWCQEKLLPLFMTSEIHNLLITDATDNNSFKIFIEDWMKDPEKSNFLKTNYSEELAMFNLVQDNMLGASYYTEQCLTMFLKDWSNLNPLSNELRLMRLLNIQRTAEIQMFLQAHSLNDKVAYAANARRLVKKWRNNLTMTTDSLSIWEFKIGYRLKFSEYMKKQLRSSEFSFIIDEINDCNVEMELSILDAAIAQKNIGVSRKYVRKLKDLSDHSDIEKNYRWRIARCQQIFIQVLVEARDVDKRATDCFRSWRMFESLLVDENILSYSGLYTGILHGIVDTSLVLKKIVNENENVFETVDNLYEYIQARAQPEGPESAGMSLEKYAYQKLNQATNFMDNIDSSMSDVEVSNRYQKDKVNCYMKLARFCQENLVHCESDMKFTYVSSLIKSILEAMILGSQEARQLFPVLLQYDVINKDLKEVFSDLSSRVPEWMFIQWAPQMLAQLVGPRSEAIGPIVIRLAESYPGALHYPFRLSILNYKYKTGSYAELCVAKLKLYLMTNPLIDTFIEALSCLCLPEALLLTNIDKLKETHQVSPKLWHSTCNEVKRLLFSPHLHVLRGEAFKVLLKFEKYFDEYIDDPTPKNHFKIRNSINVLSKNRPALLKDLCPWLTNFNGGEENNLEIPGQYHGHKKPLPQYHITIAKFDPKINVLISQRLPIKFSVLGNDAKDHIYLMKYGEDLRLDQRIQQLFTLMNQQLASDSACKFRRLSIMTYQVVPLSIDLGMIEWISDTKSLREVMYSGIKEKDKQNAMYNIPKLYSEWILKASSPNEHPKSLTEVYGNACVGYTRDKVISKYQELVNSIPSDILKISFKDISISAEGFFTLRRNFGSSYGVMCIAHWLLGIGDRHLSNCLISVKSGHVLGIDFNCAFGSGVQALPVPELVPFRLTPHIMNLMEPTANFGLLPRTMVHTLSTLRNSKSILYATMNIFVHEPLLNWTEHIKTLAGLDDSDILNYTDESGQTDENDQTIAYVKLHTARRKLEGSNPIRTLEDELKTSIVASVSNQHYLNAYINRAVGQEHYNVRKRQKLKELTPTEQVECLIDLATDRSVLGISWKGWEPWM